MLSERMVGVNKNSPIGVYSACGFAFARRRASANPKAEEGTYGDGTANFWMR